MLLPLWVVSTTSIAYASPNLKRAFDYASSGQYNIYNCGGDKASQIHDLLDHLYDDLLPAISDSERQYPSLAFQTFFKNSTNAPFVTALLTNVTKGTAMTPAAPPFSPNGSPTFFCVNGEDQFIYTAPDTATNIKRRYDTYTTCLKNPTHAAIFLGFTPPKQFIVICPVFWTDALPAVPPPETCLSVSMYTNKFRENGRRQRQFRIWILLEELAHYYIYTSTLRKDAPDIYDVNKCFRLAAETAYLNAVSYVYYVANIYGKCTGFPFPRDRDRELFEVFESGDPSGPVGSDSTVTSYDAIDMTIANG